MVKKNNVEAEYKPAYTLSLWPRNFWKLKLSDFKTLPSSDLYCKKKKNDFLENYPVVNVVLNVKEVNYNLEICCLKVSVSVTKECKRILCDKITATKFLVEIDMEHWYVLYFLFFFYKSSFVEVYFPNIQNIYV